MNSSSTHSPTAKNICSRKNRSEPLDPAAAPLARIAELAPSLGPAELRIMLALATRIHSPHHPTALASSRKLAQATGLSRRAVQAAIDSLNARGLIATRQGTAQKAAAHRLRCLEIPALTHGEQNAKAPLDGWRTNCATPGEPSAPPLLDGWRTDCATPGEPSAPPPTENQPLTPPSATPIDQSIEIIDRLLRAKESDYPAELITTARRWLHGYALKLGRDKDRHPPDGRIVAQFLSIAPWPQLEGLLYDLLAERKEPGYSYAWFVTVALQRLHGIQPATLRERRAALKLVTPGRACRDQVTRTLTAGVKSL